MPIPFPMIENWREKESYECIIRFDVSKMEKREIMDLLHETCIKIKSPDMESVKTIGILSLIKRSTLAEEVTRAMKSNELEFRLGIRIKQDTQIEVFRSERGRSSGIAFTLHKAEPEKRRGGA